MAFKRRGMNFRGCFLYFLLIPCFLFSLPLAGMGVENSTAELKDEALALHIGQEHQRHHGDGRPGSGICPQTRTTPRAPEEDYDKKNPLEATRRNLDVGESLFNLLAEPTACKICHGAKGNGLGLMAQGLSPMPRNFTCAETMRKISDGQIFWIIRNGSPGTGMVPSKFLTDEQIWQLTLYIRRFVR